MILLWLFILDIINGYVISSEERKDLFTTEDVKLIFGNLKELFQFQDNFLRQLESAYTEGDK